MTCQQSNVVAPEVFNERFTVPQRNRLVVLTLSQMTAGDVLAAMDWQANESDRLIEAAKKPARKIARLQREKVTGEQVIKEYGSYPSVFATPVCVTG